VVIKKLAENSNLNMVTGERGNKNKITQNSNLKMVTGERGNKKISSKL